MSNRMNMHRGSAGFTLIEALITLVVLSFGLLAVAKFQNTLVSGSASNKARSEAVQLAQQKLDALRTYATQQQLVSNLMGTTFVSTDATQRAYNFPVSVVDGSYQATPESIDGINATFARQWTVDCPHPATGDASPASNTCSVVVNVTWTDLRQGTQTVSLDTHLAWKNPRGTADLDDNSFTPAVPSATGRAYLGDGTVSQTDGDAGHDNGDGTATVQNGDDNVLVDLNNPNDDGTYNIVLTLENACVSGTCTEFVTISGTVYIASSFTAANIFVLASDAAYCARDLEHLATTTPNGNYRHFDYTCYLGGGWHGNIGIVLNDGGVNDEVCLGDPNASTVLGTDAWKRVELAKRRVYRGMLNKVSGGAPVTDNGGNVLYYSQGIHDAVHLPDANWSARNYGHDYVVASLSGNPTKADCLPVLTRPDSNSGALFFGVATDFVCLNEDNDVNATPYLDTFTTPYSAPSYCPYDPSRGPALVYHITGTVTVSAPSTLDGTGVETSSAVGNCTFDGTGLSSATYDCKVYDWGTGWTGYINVGTAGTSLVCADSSWLFTNITSTSTTAAKTHNFNCNQLATPHIAGDISAPLQDLSGVSAIATRSDGVAVDCGPVIKTAGDASVYHYDCSLMEATLNAGWSGTVALTLPVDSTIYCPTMSKSYGAPSVNPAVSTSLTAEDYTCRGPQTAHTITIPVTSTVDLTAYSGGGAVATAEADACTFTRVADNLSGNITCVVYGYTDWSGTVTITPPTGLYCTNLSQTRTVSADITGSTVACEVDTTGRVIVEGGIDVTASGVAQLGITMTVSGVAVGSCAVNGISGTVFSYRCTTTNVVQHGTTWTGQITVLSNKTVCNNPKTQTGLLPSSTTRGVDFWIAASCTGAP